MLQQAEVLIILFFLIHEDLFIECILHAHSNLRQLLLAEKKFSRNPVCFIRHWKPIGSQEDGVILHSLCHSEAQRRENTHKILFLECCNNSMPLCQS